MKETVVQKLFLFIVILWIMLSLVFVYQDLSRKINTISQENKEFIWDKEFYASQLWELHRKLDILIENKDYQNKQMIVNINKAIDDKFNEWLNCVIE